MNLKKGLLNWLTSVEEKDGIPPEMVIAFHFGLIESTDGFTMYVVGAFEYSEDDDDWANLEPPTKPYRYYRLPNQLQNENWEKVLRLCTNALVDLENEGSLHTTFLKNAIAITTGFDDGDLVKIR